ncbi:hypothetical protein J3S85_37280 [Streptomyces lavenduligriseus]|nr:hypothetical protein J3S85_37280 [Streptomyces lavenduligriseus]
MQLPATVAQLILLVVALLPGVVYQFVRESRRGQVPGERDLGHRLLRALTVSVVLDSVYVAVLGGRPVELAQPGRFPGHSREAALYALTLLFVLPALAALTVSRFEERRLRARYRGTPTAWDHMFRDRGGCYLRARLKDGTWVGGWYGNNSYATSFPQAPELYLERSYRMAVDGTFGDKVQNTRGLYVRGEDIDILELVGQWTPPMGPRGAGDDARSSAA